ncbi:MAG: bifunctional diaminohydroxyphosphoribosylaminopyrimidine deaminase/5-amino-6-(5-phosphoribosylamino)uracil reductase RibD [Flavobacteriales bacterium]|nr:bifunctional diaminohydroxyphosphoribosylaminopyrimidine deaminase/5-amino-6-(5-phosphoribosylamino)uracil reductase RibD [Flavobacteriales bacterium]
MNFDESYMSRCLDLAKLGMGKVAPNPMVGCVVVHNGNIIGEGFHQQYGGNHAEVNAIQAVKNKSLLKESTLYVNLEPCAHFGKTPPCANLIVEHNIPRVVIGCVDSYSEVSGKGIEKLQNAGIELTVGVLENESLELNKRFFTFHNKKRPYIILKWAETKDGFFDVDRGNEIAGLTRNNVDNWITNDLSKKLVHKWRSEEMAIMVGTNTALNDNPRLTVREWKGENPTRIVIDLHDRLPQSLNIFDKSIPTIVFSLNKETSTNNLTYVKINDTKTLLKEALNELHKRNIQSVIVEGGATLLQSFIDQQLWDEARVFIGNKKFTTGLKAPSLKGNLVAEEQIDVDHLKWIVNN